MKSKSGFSIVEVGIIIVVIGILATIGTISYLAIQREARDSKRSAHAHIMMSALEKYYDSHGEYPSGCPTTPCTETLSSRLSWNNGTIINTSTSSAQLAELFGQTVESIKDPASTRSNAFSFRATNYTYNYPDSSDYFYFGGITVTPPPTGSAAGVHNTLPFAYKDNRRIRCNMYYEYSVNQSSQYKVFASMFGYYSELEDKIIIYTTKHGIQPSLQSGTSLYNTPDKCTVIKG